MSPKLAATEAQDKPQLHTQDAQHTLILALCAQRTAEFPRFAHMKALSFLSLSSLSGTIMLEHDNA